MNAKDAIELLLNKQTTNIITLFEKYGNRDTALGTDKMITHTYGETYENLFQVRRETVTNLLEIGISGGFALLCYAEYFKNAWLTGIDVEEKIQADLQSNKRINLIIGNALDPNVSSSLPMFDIIIEDASHELRDQITLFVEYYRLIKPNGVYIIEDVEGRNLAKLTDILVPFANEKGFKLSVYDGREKNNRGDDILVILEKK